MPRVVRVARWARINIIGLSIGLLVACHGLLDVTDPTLVQDKDIANAGGANARRLDVIYKFSAEVGNLANNVAVFTDERTVDLPLLWQDQSYYLDRRDGEGFEALYATDQNNDPHLGGWDVVVTTAAIALPPIRAYASDSLKGDFLAQVFAIRGYAILQMAEDVCPGFPINDVVDNLPVYSGPYTTDSATHFALTQLDSALANARDSSQTINLARVTKGRALLDLGQYAQAAAAVASVPTDFRLIPAYGEGNIFFQWPYVWDPSDLFEIRFAVGDTEGTNGLPFVSAHDPRVGTFFAGVRYHNAADSLYDQTKYAQPDLIVISSGIEARLIEAEAAINGGDPSWFAILNTLRATMITPAMPALQTMPTAKADQLDLLYRERAFWLYLTGRRLGDMRRLIRNYGRAPETVFPTGPYSMRGGNYGTATAIPFVKDVEHRYNAKITSGCTTR